MSGSQQILTIILNLINKVDKYEKDSYCLLEKNEPNKKICKKNKH